MTETEPRKRWWIALGELVLSRPWAIVILLLTTLVLLGFIGVDQLRSLTDVLKGLK